MKRLFIVSFVLSLLGACTNKESSTDSLVKIGSATFNKTHLDGYEKALRLYPTRLSEYFPGSKAAITQMVETEILSSKAAHLKNQLLSSKDWQWKKQYFPAQLYVMEYLPSTLGFPENSLKSYYDKNKEQFKKSVQADTTGKDSTYYQTFDEVKDQVAEKLFLDKYPPDSAFLSKYQTTDDTTTIRNEWIYSIKSKLPQFFMEEFFKQEYGKTYPDSLSEIYGDGKIITPADMEIILSWVPEDRRDYYKSESANRELVEWLLKWKLFSIQAQKAGLTETPSMKMVMDWAQKIDIVDQYVEKELVPKLLDGFTVDTQMVTYSLYDDGLSANKNFDQTALSNKINELYQSYKVMRLDSVLHSEREKNKIKFLQSDFKDDRDMNPSVLLQKADSLRDTGLVDEAEKNYSTLSQDFLFSHEGKKALVELAKIQTERQNYQSAIANYRKHLLLTQDDGKRCNTFFMIGFIYDEHLDRPDQAEINYKWILKNTPDCDLADDAEFMVLHLDEPMSSVEELRAEAIRQGRKLESFEEDITNQDSAAVSKPTALN